ncbi:MAG: peptidyl-prolyl cis-trans isomerase SurA [Sodalis sp. Fle]|nr:MAG: peptidyl-prolyl cis-trans isomerase SurA [Sodalis sp. Fle]
MKNWRILILAFTLCANSAIAALQMLDKIAAVVDNSVILESDINTLLDSTKLNAQYANQLPDDATLRRQILDRLIMDKIILQLAQRANITVSKNQLDQTISNIAAQNHITIDQLRNHLGTDYNTYRAQICKKMLISEVHNGEVHRRIIILPQEIESLTKQIAETSDSADFNLSYILIPLPENPTQDQVDKAETLAKYLVTQSKNDEDFTKLIITHSTDTQTLKGGQIGWSKLEKLPILLAEYLQGAKKGSIIGPIPSSVGFHILKINDIRYNDQKVPLTEVHTLHILLQTSVVMTDQQARAKLLDIAQQINSGRTNFSTAAKQISEDPGSASQGGDLGWNATENFDPAFRDALMHLKKGEISSPIRSSYGWHLIQLIDTRHVDRTDATKKDQAYRLLFNRKFAEKSQTWIEEQRASTYVKILDNNVQ